MEPREVAARNFRFSTELSKSQTSGYEPEFLGFEVAAATASAIICMPVTRLFPIASEDTVLFATFGLQVESEMRAPQDNVFDKVRSSVEEAVFPMYSKDVRFGALSLTDEGQTAYGGSSACSVKLKDVAVADRATVFDTPLIDFAKANNLALGDQIPLGHRAPWLERGRLAAAKLGSKLKGSTPEMFASLLLPTPIDTVSDCIEVHIYGPLSRRSIGGVTMRQAERRADRILQEDVIENLEKIGVGAKII